VPPSSIAVLVRLKLSARGAALRTATAVAAAALAPSGSLTLTTMGISSGPTPLGSSAYWCSAANVNTPAPKSISVGALPSPQSIRTR
jgi:hypothetical protein